MELSGEKLTCSAPLQLLRTDVRCYLTIIDWPHNVRNSHVYGFRRVSTGKSRDTFLRALLHPANSLVTRKIMQLVIHATANWPRDNSIHISCYSKIVAILVFALHKLYLVKHFTIQSLIGHVCTLMYIEANPSVFSCAGGEYNACPGRLPFPSECTITYVITVNLFQ